MKLRLAIKVGDKSGVLHWQHTHCTVGRGACHLKLHDKTVSEQHLVLYEDERGHLRMRDLNSTNGTLVNSTKTEACVLGVGDTLRLGATTIVIDDFASEGRAWRGLLQAADMHSKSEKTNATETTHAGGEPSYVPPKTNKVQRDELLCNTWPDQWTAHPKEVQNKFETFKDKPGSVQSNGRKR